MKKIRKCLAVVMLMTMVMTMSAMADEIQPYAMGTGSNSVYTASSGGNVLNCNTNYDAVPSQTKINVWGYTGNLSQKWAYNSTTHRFYPFGSSVVLNCKRGGEYQVDVVSPSVNTSTPEDMYIVLYYTDKNQKAFRINVASRGSYPSAYVTRSVDTSGSACYWRYSSGLNGQIWNLH